MPETSKLAIDDSYMLMLDFLAEELKSTPQEIAEAAIGAAFLANRNKTDEAFFHPQGAGLRQNYRLFSLGRIGRAASGLRKRRRRAGISAGRLEKV